MRGSPASGQNGKSSCFEIWSAIGGFAEALLVRSQFDETGRTLYRLYAIALQSTSILYPKLAIVTLR